jgi:hypothetical protein
VRPIAGMQAPSLGATRPISTAALGLAGIAGIGALVGMEAYALLLAVIGVIGAVVALRLSFTQWCLLLIISTLATRPIFLIFGGPSLLGFLHYPIAIEFAVASLFRFKNRNDASHIAGLGLIALVILATISMLANGSGLIRFALFLVIYSEPFVVLFAITRWQAGTVAWRHVGLGVACLLTIQIPVGIWQGATIGWSDPVVGTISGNGPEAHVLGTVFALATLLLIAAATAGRVSKPATLLCGLAALGMMIASGSNQVIVASSVALLALPLSKLRPTVASLSAPRLAATVGGVVLVLVLSVSGLALMEKSKVLDRAGPLARPNQLPEARLIRDRTGNPVQFFIGSGPGTTASRASLLLTPRLLKETSPVASLHLPPTKAALEIASDIRAKGGGSAEAVASGTLGLLGDLGIFGFLAFLTFVVCVWRRTGTVSTWPTSAARASLVMTLALMFVDNWFEYPGYAIPLMLLTGLALQENMGGTREVR